MPFQIYKHDKAQRGKEFPKVTQQDCGRSGRQLIRSSTSRRHHYDITLLMKHFMHFLPILIWTRFTVFEKIHTHTLET